MWWFSAIVSKLWVKHQRIEFSVNFFLFHWNCFVKIIPINLVEQKWKIQVSKFSFESKKNNNCDGFFGSRECVCVCVFVENFHWLTGDFNKIQRQKTEKIGIYTLCWCPIECGWRGVRVFLFFSPLYLSLRTCILAGGYKRRKRNVKHGRKSEIHSSIEYCEAHLD